MKKRVVSISFVLVFIFSMTLFVSARNTGHVDESEINLYISNELDQSIANKVLLQDEQNIEYDNYCVVPQYRLHFSDSEQYAINAYRALSATSADYITRYRIGNYLGLEMGDNQLAHLAYESHVFFVIASCYTSGEEIFQNDDYFDLNEILSALNSSCAPTLNVAKYDICWVTSTPDGRLCIRHEIVRWVICTYCGFITTPSVTLLASGCGTS